MATTEQVADSAKDLVQQSLTLSQQIHQLQMQEQLVASSGQTFLFGFTVFVLACFVGYYVVWKVTPALHTPLMSVTNAISGIIIVGAIIAVGSRGEGISHTAGFIAVTIASINIFGGFIVTQRMLSMFQKKKALTPKPTNKE